MNKKKTKIEIKSASAEQTCKTARLIGEKLREGDILALSGELGSGKTCFTGGLARGLGVDEKYRITSPTFTLINEYPARCKLYHFDVYGTTGGATIDQSGSGLLTFDSAFAATGAGAKTLTIQGSTAGTGAISGIIGDGSGTVAITKTGSNTWTLSGANTNTGATTISTGTLKVQGVAFSTTPRTWAISPGATLNIDGNTGVATGTTIISGTGTLYVTNGTFKHELPNAPVGAGRNITMSLGAGGLINIAATGSMGNGGWANINWAANLAALNVDGFFDLWNGSNVIVDALTGAGTVTCPYGGTVTLTVGTNNGSGTFSGVFQDSTSTVGHGTGTPALTKNGTGTQILSGVNTFTGATTVNNGTLLVTGSTVAGSAVAVNNGGTLGGSGTIAGTINVANGGTLAPGTGGTTISTLNTGAVTFNATSIYSIDLNGTGPVNDQIISTGVVTCAGTLTIASILNAALGPVYTIASGTSVAGTFSGLPNGSLFIQQGRTFLITYNAASVTLTDVATPTLPIWNGLGGNNNWSIAANWNGIAPVAGQDLQFAGAVRPGPSNDFVASTNFGAITFNSGTAAFTITGNKIALSGDITNNSANLQTLNIAMAMAATHTVNTATANITIGGILSGAGGVTKTGPNTLTLSGVNTFTGATTVSAGTLKAGVITQAFGVNSAITLANTGERLWISLVFPMQLVLLPGLLVVMSRWVQQPLRLAATTPVHHTQGSLAGLAPLPRMETAH